MTSLYIEFVSSVFFATAFSQSCDRASKWIEAQSEEHILQDILISSQR